MKHLLLPISLLLSVALLSGCALSDPENRPGEWRPISANPLNMAAMAADPHDLVRGQSSADGNSDGQLAAAAIDRMRKGKLKDLGETGVSNVKATGTGGPSGTGGN